MYFLFRKEVATILTFSWMGLIFYFSHQPGSVSSELSSSLLLVLDEVLNFSSVYVDMTFIHLILRKSAHFLVYLVLGILLLHTIYLFLKKLKVSSLIAVIFGFLFALSDEFHQTFIPGRSGELRDVLIDTVGIFFGVFIYVLMFLQLKHMFLKYKDV